MEAILETLENPESELRLLPLPHETEAIGPHQEDLETGQDAFSQLLLSNQTQSSNLIRVQPPMQNVRPVGGNRSLFCVRWGKKAKATRYRSDRSYLGGIDTDGIENDRYGGRGDLIVPSI